MQLHSKISKNHMLQFLGYLKMYLDLNNMKLYCEADNFLSWTCSFKKKKDVSCLFQQSALCDDVKIFNEFDIILWYLVTFVYVQPKEVCPDSQHYFQELNQKEKPKQSICQPNELPSIIDEKRRITSSFSFSRMKDKFARFSISVFLDLSCTNGNW